MTPPRKCQFSTTTNGARSDRQGRGKNQVGGGEGGTVDAVVAVVAFVVAGWGAVVVTRRTVVVVRRRVVVVRRSVVRVVTGGTVVGGSVVLVSTGPELTERLTVEPLGTFLPGVGSTAYTTPAATVSFGML